jgi:hypothetical protein
MPQKNSVEGMPSKKSDRQDNSRSYETKIEAGEKSNVGVASDFDASGNSTVNIGSTITNNFSNSTCKFFRLKQADLQSLESPFFPTLNQIDDILHRLKKSRILLFGGTHEDKQEIAIHIAAKLKQELESQSSAPNSISILKWNSVSDYKGILAEIRGEEDERTESHTRIIVLPDLKPDYIAFDIARINQAIQDCQCYVIADTDNPLTDWQIKEPQQEEIWQDTTNISYELSSLAEAAVRRIVRAEIDLNTLENDFRQQIITLKTVSRVKDCIQWLKNEERSNEERSLDFEAIKKAITKASQDRSATLERWFKELKPRQQLIAIGVTLFKDLFSNQFFAAVERVVEKTWHKRESSLYSLDYSDLSFFGNYCEFISGSYQYASSSFIHINTQQKATEFEISQLKLRRSEEAHLLLKVAWNTYQRQIIKALKEMAQMAEDSVSKVKRSSSDWELFGDDFQSQQLRDVVGQTLGEIGLVSLGATNAVQNTLLSLATHNSIEVRDVAAKAIASWYPDDRFYETLLYLYSIVLEEPLDSANRVADYIGATVAMTVSYAALSDLPDRLSEQLLNWMEELAESKRLVVRAHLGYHTLALAVPRHFVQLQPFIKKLIEKYSEFSEDGNGLADAIGGSLAQAYKQYPGETLDLIEEGFQCWKKPGSRLTRTKFIEAQKIRGYWADVLAITLRQICFPEPPSPELSGRIFNYLLELSRANKKTTRKLSIQALYKRIVENFSLLSDAILENAEKLPYDARTAVCEAIIAVYLQQRKVLSKPTQGDLWYSKNEDLYRSWLDNDRPLTEIEETLYVWLGNKNRPTAQKLATQAFINFAKEFEVGEARFIRRFKAGRLSDREFLYQDNLLLSEPMSRDSGLPAHSATVLSGFWAWLAIFPTALPEMIRNLIWTPDIVKQYQPIIRNILPQAVIQTRENDEAVQFVVNKWKESKTKQLLGKSKDAPELMVMANFLRPSLWLAKNPGAFFLGVGVATLIGCIAVGVVLDGIRQNSDRASNSPSERKSSPASSTSSNSNRSPNAALSSSNSFESEAFPKATCGDSLPTNPQSYPISFYPVFIDYSESNLRQINVQFCQDAYRITREANNKVAIQVASFTSPGRAEEFRAFLASRFGNAEVGEPRIIQEP